MPPLRHLRWTNQLSCIVQNFGSSSFASKQQRVVLILSASNRCQIAWKSTDTVSATSKIRTDDDGSRLDCKPPQVDAAHHHDEHHHGDHHHDPQEHWYSPPVSPIVTRHSLLKWPWYIGRLPVPSYRGAADFANEQTYEIWMGKVIRWIFWWTFWYNLLMEPGHVFGEYFIPDRYVMTDAELGIPPID